MSKIAAITVGSNTVPSRQALTSFTGSGNMMLGFGAFVNGFKFTTNTTTCSFDNFMPVAGTVHLNGGRLFLFQDLTFNNTLSFNSVGRISGNNYAINFPKSLIDFSLPVVPFTNPLIFDNTTVVFNANTTLKSPVHFIGNCTIIGGGNRVTLSRSAPLVVRPGGSLVIQDTEVYGLGDNNMRCMTDSGGITIQNSNLVLGRDYTFSNGAILFQDDVVISGTNKFVYAASRTSTIASGAMVGFDLNTTLSYAPRVGKRGLIAMADGSSSLYLNGCTLFSTRTGLDISGGSVFIDNKVTVSSDARFVAEGLTFKSSTAINILAGGLLDMYGFIKAE